MTTTITRRETDTLKARYDEALAIKDAWDHRVARANAEYRAALTTGQGVQQAQNNLNAVNIQHSEAIAYMGTCLDAWLDAVDTARHRATTLALSASNTPGRLHAHRTH
ncbi:hypothetical protein ACTAQI_20225 [Pseudarthrobacter sp. alpha12b]